MDGPGPPHDNDMIDMTVMAASKPVRLDSMYKQETVVETAATVCFIHSPLKSLEFASEHWQDFPFTAERKIPNKYLMRSKKSRTMRHII